MPGHSDVLIAGGGLTGALTALRFALSRPEARVTLVEASSQLGGTAPHTWSFHECDLSEESALWIKPLVSKSWSTHSVIFPKFTRQFERAYHSIRSEDFARDLSEKLRAAPNVELRLNTTIEKLSQSHAFLVGGESLRAGLVLDARGLNIDSVGPCGYKKFIGYDVVLEEAHQITAPISKDVSCPQLDGYRFFYLLPWDEKRLLIEETFYSDTPHLNPERIDRSIRNYAQRRGWKVLSMERKEQGVLPIPMTAGYIPTSVEGEAIAIGTRGGFFHATTGNALPDTVRLAEFLSALPELTTQSAREALNKFRRPFLSRQRFYRVINRLLFLASEPAMRYIVWQKFYELTGDVIDRFAAGRSTWTDRVRILSGKSHVPLSRALKSFAESSVLERERSKGEA